MSEDTSNTTPTNSAPTLDPLHTPNDDTNPITANPEPNFRSDTTKTDDFVLDSDEEDYEHVVVDDVDTENMEALSISTSRNDRIWAIADEMIKATMAGQRPSEGIPELVFMLGCPMHWPDQGLGKGLFKIADKGLGRMSVSQLLTYVEALVRDAKTGCGVEGCPVTLEDAILESCEEDIICFRCPDKSLVSPKTACIMHDDTNHLNLVMVALAEVVKWYSDKARKVMFKGTPLM